MPVEGSVGLVEGATRDAAPELLAPIEGAAVISSSERHTTDSTTIAALQSARAAAGHCSASESFTWTRATTSSFPGSAIELIGEIFRPSIDCTKQ